MLCGIRTADNSKVFARQVAKDHGPFYCAGCKGELIVHKGNIKIHHFAHKPPFNCSRGEGESEAHRKCKETIYIELSAQPNVTELDMEKDFVTVVSDVYCRINNVPVAIEAQRSNLSVNEIVRRTVAYEKLGIHVMWLALYNDKLEEERYSPKAWEKWCHALYFGRVYYWKERLTVLPVHFGPFYKHVEETSWFEEGGVARSEGGYDKILKQHKALDWGSCLNLAKDFKATTKQSWNGGLNVFK